MKTTEVICSLTATAFVEVTYFQNKLYLHLPLLSHVLARCLKPWHIHSDVKDVF